MPEITVALPTLHSDQVSAWNARKGLRRFALRCGRRWGKSIFLQVLACDALLKGKLVAYFTPDYKLQLEFWEDVKRILTPVLTESNQQKGIMRTMTGGTIEFWTLNNENAARGRRYHLALIDEAAFTLTIDMARTWELNIERTLYDFSGSAVVASNTAELDDANWFQQICTQPDRWGFTEYHAPQQNNPIIPMRLDNETYENWQARRLVEQEDQKRRTHPLAYKKEILAEFVDFKGDYFFKQDWLLVDGKPAPLPKTCTQVFCVIDCAVKTGKEHDATACIWFAHDPLASTSYKTWILDWDTIQIEGASLEQWLPIVFKRGRELATQCRARGGFTTAYIEDASAGQVLLQQAKNHNWPANPLPSKFVALGKDVRAYDISGYVYQGLVKITEHAFLKTSVLKGIDRNHLLHQIGTFRIGDKDAAKRADDLLDCFTGGVMLACGSVEGY